MPTGTYHTLLTSLVKGLSILIDPPSVSEYLRGTKPSKSSFLGWWLPEVMSILDYSTLSTTRSGDQTSTRLEFASLTDITLKAADDSARALMVSTFLHNLTNASSTYPSLLDLARKYLSLGTHHERLTAKSGVHSRITSPPSHSAYRHLPPKPSQRPQTTAAAGDPTDDSLP